MARSQAAPPAHENPLIPHAKLRQLYRAMLRMRLLGKALKSKRRGQSLTDYEAALAATSVDLTPGDLVSDVLAGGVIAFVRGATLSSVLQPDAGRRGRTTAECGSAGCLPHDLPLQERLWLALGAAAGLKATATRADARDSSARMGVVVTYLVPGDTPTPILRKALTIASTEQLPVLFVAFRTPDVSNSGKLAAIALQHGIPGMAVDADDTIAIYRVAQEAIGHARIGGGAALIECLPFALEGSRAARPDAFSALEKYILNRGAVGEPWVRQETQSFAKRIAG